MMIRWFRSRVLIIINPMHIPVTELVEELGGFYRFIFYLYGVMKTGTRIFLICCLALCAGTGCSGHNRNTVLLPLPQEVAWRDGYFCGRNVRLAGTAAGTEAVRDFLVESGAGLSQNADRVAEVTLVERLDRAKVNQDEAYRLLVTRKSLKIEAVSERGVYWAVQTLRQLADSTGRGVRIPCCEITDWPAFRIRGFMHDTGRSYISPEELKKEIALLSRYKINTFHWHLTENQAWRLESKIYPKLNSPENTVRFPGCFYTHEQVRDILDFCRRHQVMLIPEIDMPGHSAAFVRTFGCSMQSPEGKAILKELIGEACDLFAEVPYFHIGTDEVHFTDPQFVPEMVSFVRSKGKKVISWNPGYGYAPGEIDMTQLWSYRGKAQPGIPAIDSRFHYANHFDLFGDIVALYNSRIYDSDCGSDDLAGTIVAFWNDRKLPDERNILSQNAFYPYMLAIAERSWMGGGSEYFDSKGVILPPDTSRVFREFADFERRMLWHKENCFAGESFPYVKQTDVRWAVTDAFPNDGDLSRSFPPEKGLTESYTFEGKEYGVRKVTGAGIYLRHVWGSTVPALYREPKENSTAYAWTWVYSPKSQDLGLLVEFQNYSRSENDLPPPSGRWDYSGSRIYLNDRELLPPEWTGTHTEKSSETPLGNENCTARPPLPVHLDQGWNKVFIKLPVGRFTTPEIRLVKWMFTAVFVTPDGSRAAEGLTYSPDRKR